LGALEVFLDVLASIALAKEFIEVIYKTGNIHVPM